MKKAAFLFLLLLLIFPLSCKEKTELLTYQQSSFCYDAKLSFKDSGKEYTIRVTKADDSSMSLEFTFPEELSLVSFKKDDSGVYPICNGKPWEGVSFPHAEEVFSLFCIDPESFVLAESSTQGEVPICRASFENGITVTLDSRDNRPLIIENDSLKLTFIK